MKLLQLKAKVRPKKAYRHPVMDKTSDNLLNRRFEAEKPNEKWLTDATGFKCSNGKLYLSPISDVFNRETVAYAMSRRPNSEMVERMLNDAVCKLTKADKVLPHSDRAVPYGSLPPHVGGIRHSEKYVASRQLLGQCTDGKLLCDTEDGMLLY